MGVKEVFNKVKNTLDPRENDWFNNQQENNSEEDYGDYDYTEPDNSRWELQFNQEISDYAHRLANERKNFKGIWEQIPGTKPVMNVEGISHTTAMLSSVVNKGTPLGVSKIEYVNLFTRSYTRSYKTTLLLNYKEYGLKPINITGLTLSFLQQIRSILSRSINDGERKIRSKKMNFNESYKHDEVSLDEIGGSNRVI